LQGDNALMLAGWFIRCSLSTFAHQFTKKKEAKKKYSNSSIYFNKIMNTNLKAGLDVVIFGCGSLSASVSAGQASLGFCLLSFTFISLFSSGWGRTQQ